MTIQLCKTRYRLSGGYIGADAIAIGSSATAAALTAIGTVTIAHGMGTTPTAAFGQPLATGVLNAVGRGVGLVGIDCGNMTFITASGAPMASQDATYIASAYSSGITMTFVWMAVR